MQESIVFLVRVQCRRKESSRSLSHLLMSFLSILTNNYHKLPQDIYFHSQIDTQQLFHKVQVHCTGALSVLR